MHKTFKCFCFVPLFAVPIFRNLKGFLHIFAHCFGYSCSCPLAFFLFVLLLLLLSASPYAGMARANQVKGLCP